MIEALLYRLGEGERSNAFPAVWMRTARTDSAATGVEATLQNDLQGRVILLRSLTGQYVPGAGQNVTQAQLDLLPPEGTSPPIQLFLKFDGVAKGANVVASLDWQGEIVIPPRWSARARAAFNAGAASNQVNLIAFGYSAPVGNLNPS